MTEIKPKRRQRYNYGEPDFAKQIKQYQQQRRLFQLHFMLFVFVGCGVLGRFELWEYWMLFLGLHWFWFSVIYRRRMRRVRQFLRRSRRGTVTVPIPSNETLLEEEKFEETQSDYIYTADGEILEVIDSTDWSDSAVN